MNRTVRVIICFLMSFSLMLTFGVSLFADNPTAGEPNLVADHFAEADALRYGSIFGPLGSAGILTGDFIQQRNTDVVGISTRDLGFGSGEPHYTPITPVRETSGSS